MPLRHLLKSLGLGERGAVEADPLVDQLRPLVSGIAEERLEYLAAFAAQLARVAWADEGVSAAERAAMSDLLAQHAGLGADEATVVATLLSEERQVLREIEPTRLNRTLNAHGSRAEKENLIDCVYALAAADHLVSNREDQEVRRIAHALMIPHGRLMDIRARYRDRLEVMLLARPGGDPSAGGE